MKTFATALCIAGTALALSACETSSTYDSGASYANSRTAGQVDTMPAKRPAKVERVFRETQSK